jgi:hypothetical protein
MSDRADFCAFYYAQTGQAAVWIRDEKRFMFSNTELAWQSWQAAQAQAGDGEAPVGYYSPSQSREELAFSFTYDGDDFVPIYTRPQPAQVNQQLLDALRLAETSMLDSGYSPQSVTIITVKAAIAAAQEQGGGE